MSELERRYNDQQKLLQRALKALHRPAWKDGETDADVAAAINDWLSDEKLEAEIFGEHESMEKTIQELRKGLTIANDAMCQATFIVGKRKSDLNHAIDVARKLLDTSPKIEPTTAST
jgi:aspartate/tyrosine/aromatic aminotransferase